MRLFLDYTLSGVSSGMIYAAVALGLVLIWRSTRILNFAQGGMAMITTYIASALLEHSVGYWAAFAVALLAGLALGAATERLLIRPVEGRSPVDAVIVAIGFLIFLEALAGAIWGASPRGFPAPFSQVDYLVGGRADRLHALRPVHRAGGAGAHGPHAPALPVHRGGPAHARASAFAPEVARLLGVRVHRMLTLGWALAAMAGALAGLFVAPAVFLSPSYMDSILIYGFTAAIVGGLESPVGSLVGGLVIGLAISYVGGYLGSAFEGAGALGLLVVVLMVRPSGLFSRVQARRV